MNDLKDLGEEATLDSINLSVVEPCDQSIVHSWWVQLELPDETKHRNPGHLFPTFE
jgi:hypothetical protein